MRFPVRTALRSEPGSFSRAKVCSASTAQSIALLGTAPIWVPAAIAAPVELTIILGQDAPTEDQSGNSRRIECATSHGPCASRCRAHMRVFARKSAAVDPAATRGLRTRRDASVISTSRTFNVSAPACPNTVATLAPPAAQYSRAAPRRR